MRRGLPSENWLNEDMAPQPIEVHDLNHATDIDGKRMCRADQSRGLVRHAGQVKLFEFLQLHVEEDQVTALGICGEPVKGPRH